MSSKSITRIAIAASLVTLAIAGAVPASAMSSRPKLTESNLAAAGFRARPADTPERQAMLARLPAHQVLLRSRNGKVHYVYADPKGCNCLYVGNEAAYQRYASEMQKDRRADQQQFAAQEYSDASWNWGAWGGGFDRDFGYGPGFGW